MWPSIIFDKSTLQSISHNESVWLDQFYIPVITPIFFVETLADLEKETRHGRTPESLVGDLAYKTPEMWCIHVLHSTLINDELLTWNEIKFGRPYPAWAKTVRLGKDLGTIVMETDEIKALSRWQAWEFIELERNYAKAWRRSLQNRPVHSWDILEKEILWKFHKPKTLLELKRIIDEIMLSRQNEEWLELCLSLMHIRHEIRQIALQRWSSDKGKILASFSPYFAYVTTVNLVFNLWTSLWLFTQYPHAETQHIDISYLYYLPFINIFVSHDKFHKWVVPIFLREDQTFINWEDFKNDLSGINAHYMTFPDEIKAKGVMSFALCPPVQESFFTNQMWDKYMNPQWRDIMTKEDTHSPSEKDKVVEQVNSFMEKAIVSESAVLDSEEEVKHLWIKRMVKAKRGNWDLFSPEIVNRKKNEKGEWEAIE